MFKNNDEILSEYEFHAAEDSADDYEEVLPEEEDEDEEFHEPKNLIVLDNYDFLVHYSRQLSKLWSSVSAFSNHLF